MVATKEIREVGRIVAGAYYDMQGVRISSMNRIRDIVRKKLEGIDFDQVEEKKEEKDYVKAYTDSQIELEFKKLLEDGLCTEEEYKYLMSVINISLESKKIENKYKLSMKKYIQMEPIYTMFLKDIKGIGEVLAANLIKSYAYCEKFPTISKMWAYSGLSVIDGVAQKRKKGEQLNYSPQLKTLAWKIGDAFIKSNKGKLRSIYDEEKDKQTKRMESQLTTENHSNVANQGETENHNVDVNQTTDENQPMLVPPQNKMHCHLRAMRKMVKIFLACYWIKARTITDQEVSKPYIIGKGKHEHYISPEDLTDE